MRSWRNSRGVSVVLIVALALVAGCGKKPEVATDATLSPTTQTQVVPEAQSSSSNQLAPGSNVDCTNLDPNEYGIEDVLFPYDAYALSEAAMATLENNARIMKGHASVSYLVEGHCDERGTIEYNLALGEKRAEVVRDYLMSLGIPAARLRVVSYGEERPFESGQGEFAWSQNRRAHFARP